jgi:DNA-binding winged helix-turn-helix (wHTH) protein
MQLVVPSALYSGTGEPQNRGVFFVRERGARMSVRFGDFSFDRDRRVLQRAGEPVPLARKAFDFLDVLLAERPRALSKEQIRDRVWPKTVVSESTLNGLLGELRAALGDDAREPRYIRTVHGFGYAFVAEASEQPASSPSAASGAAASPALLTARLLWEDRLIPLSPGPNVLGRDEDVSVRIDAPSVSRRHARITIAAGEPPTVEDLGSKNGTWVAGRRMDAEKTPLKDGDVLRLGKIELLFLDSKEKGSTQTVAE